MKLDLVNGWNDLGSFNRLFYVVWEVVRDTDGFSKACRLERFQVSPGFLQLGFVALGKEWLVDEVSGISSQISSKVLSIGLIRENAQVNIVCLQLPQTILERCRNVINILIDFL